jgi:ATP-dependent DNA ligase
LYNEQGNLSLEIVFDILYHGRNNVTARPLRRRRLRLEDVVAGSERAFPVRRLAANGLEVWEQRL